MFNYRIYRAVEAVYSRRLFSQETEKLLSAVASKRIIDVPLWGLVSAGIAAAGFFGKILHDDNLATRKELSEANLATRKELSEANLATRKELSEANLATRKELHDSVRDLRQEMHTGFAELKQAIRESKSPEPRRSWW